MTPWTSFSAAASHESPLRRSTSRVAVVPWLTQVNGPWHQVQFGPTWKATAVEVPAAGPADTSYFSTDLPVMLNGVAGLTPNQPPSAASMCMPDAPSVWKAEVCDRVPALLCQLPGA